MSNHVAPAGQVYVCSACGKRSRDKYGFQRISYGWDESCALHAVLCYEEGMRMDGGLVAQATYVPADDVDSTDD